MQQMVDKLPEDGIKLMMFVKNYLKSTWVKIIPNMEGITRMNTVKKYPNHLLEDHDPKTFAIKYLLAKGVNQNRNNTKLPFPNQLKAENLCTRMGN